MADNTQQFEWIVTIKENLEILFAHQPDRFVAGDLLWYPAEGNNRLCQAPDVMVVLGRPKGHRGSYRQWQEENIAPQVVFEILSPSSNTAIEMTRKLLFYQQYGVDEYYQYDPALNELAGSIRMEGGLTDIVDLSGWVSPCLGIRFELADTLYLYGPNGERFLTSVELAEQRDQAQQRADRLAARLRELGVDPDSV